MATPSPRTPFVPRADQRAVPGCPDHLPVAVVLPGALGAGARAGFAAIMTPERRAELRARLQVPGVTPTGR
jgi:hypothetical protein